MLAYDEVMNDVVRISLRVPQRAACPKGDLTPHPPAQGGRALPWGEGSFLPYVLRIPPASPIEKRNQNCGACPLEPAFRALPFSHG